MLNPEQHKQMQALIQQQMEKANAVKPIFNSEVKPQPEQPKVEEVKPQPQVETVAGYNVQVVDAINIFDLLKEEEEPTPAPTIQEEEKPNVETVAAPLFILNNTIEEEKPQGLYFTDYTEKAVILQGEGTKEHRDILKEMGGIYRTTWKCGAGWMFAKKHRQTLADILGIE